MKIIISEYFFRLVVFTDSVTSNYIRKKKEITFRFS